MSRQVVYFISLLMLIAGISCKTQRPVRVQHVRNLDAGHTLQGFYYALPRTVLIVDITVVSTSETPGPYARYAEKFLGLEEVITDKTQTFEIREVNVSQFAEPDPAEYYFAELNPEENRKNPLSVYLHENGIIAGINAPFDEQEYLLNNSVENKYGYFGTEATFNHFVESNLHEKVDTIIQQVRMDTITVERRTLRRRLVEKSSEIKAKEVADYILKIREKKFDLLSGFAEITYSREALKYMNDQLTQQENDYLELFTGLTTQSFMKYRYYFIPEKNTASVPYTLFHFSEREGLLKEEQQDSQEVRIQVTRSNTTRQPAVFLMNPDRGKDIDTGFYYRIPEHGNVTILQGNMPLAESRMLINQYGIITSLPPVDLKIEYYPNTGSIKSVEKIK
ncbi:MAG: DUF4831 family protein [Bacteroidales bacterium]